jgi:hypothetical protein
MGQKPKKDKDRLKKQKILHPKEDKHKSQLEKKHMEHLSGGHNRINDTPLAYDKNSDSWT